MPNRGANRARVGSQLGIADGVRSLIHTTEQRVVSGYSTAPRSSHRGAVCFAKRTRRRAGALAQTSAHLHHARSDPVLTSVNGVLHTTNYFHDGDNLWVIAIADGKQLVSVTTSYPGIDQPHSIYQNGAISYYLQDVSGNITGLVDTAGTLQNHYSYLPFGAADTTAEAVTNTLKFAAREYDAEVGLYYMRARYYDPGLGRFISEDPIGLAGGMNAYSYASNAPADMADPFGLDGDPTCTHTTEADSQSCTRLHSVAITGQADQPGITITTIGAGPMGNGIPDNVGPLPQMPTGGSADTKSTPLPMVSDAAKAHNRNLTCRDDDPLLAYTEVFSLTALLNLKDPYELRAGRSIWTSLDRRWPSWLGADLESGATVVRGNIGRIKYVGRLGTAAAAVTAFSTAYTATALLRCYIESR